MFSVEKPSVDLINSWPMIIWFLLPLLSPRGEKELRSAAAAICVISQKNEPKVRPAVSLAQKRGGAALHGAIKREGKEGNKKSGGFSCVAPLSVN